MASPIKITRACVFIFLLVLALNGTVEARYQSTGSPEPLVAQADRLWEGYEITRQGPEQLAPVLAATDQAPALEYDPRIAGMISQVTQEQVYDYAAKLTGAIPANIAGSSYTIANRYTYGGGPIQKATQFVYEHFSVFGLEPTYQVWGTINSPETYPNVIGTLTGSSRPDEITLITAHLDGMPVAPVAPGADDNASGVTGVLVAAQVISQYEWDCTMRFVAFTGEEQGLLGSTAYASQLSSLGEKINGVLNLDMIAYNTPGSRPIVDLHANSNYFASVIIANTFANVISTYEIDLQPEIFINSPLANSSDNRSFWDRGYPAILAIEDYHDLTPYYHRVSDDIQSLNMDYFTNFVKAAVGTFAHMACMGEFEKVYLPFIANQSNTASGW